MVKTSVSVLKMSYCLLSYMSFNHASYLDKNPGTQSLIKNYRILFAIMLLSKSIIVILSNHHLTAS